MTTAIAAIKKYTVPDFDFAEDLCPDRMEFLAELVKIGSKPGKYEEVRSKIAALNFWLSKSTTIAPAFRPNIALKPRKGAFTIEEENIIRDRMYFDLEWLVCTGDRHEVRDTYYKGMIGLKGQFDIELAEEFLSERWTAAYRAEEVLCLSDFQMAQMNTLVSKDFFERRQRVYQGTRAPVRTFSIESVLRVIMNQAADRDSRLKSHAPDYVCLGVARALLKSVAKPRAIAQLAAWMNDSDPMPDRKVIDRLVKIDKWGREFAPTQKLY